MEQFTQTFLEFIDAWGYVAVAVLMASENACIPIPSELILGFSGYLIFADRMGFVGAMIAGMAGGMAGSIFAYLVGRYGVRTFISLPAGFAHVDMKKFLLYTFLGSLPWTALILGVGMALGESWQIMLKVGHEVSIAFVVVSCIIVAGLYWRYRRNRQQKANMDVE